MEYQIKTLVSTSLWNHTISFPSGNRAGGEMANKQQSHSVFFQKKEPNPPFHFTEKTNPEKQVKDNINSPEERKKEVPQEEFIETDPNFNKQLSKEEKKEIREQAEDAGKRN